MQTPTTTPRRGWLKWVAGAALLPLLIFAAEFALFDFRLHAEFEPTRGARLLQTLTEVRDEVAVVRPPAFNRFPHSFQHIFSGGYSAGYYSYIWCEVLDSDAFELFRQRRLFDPATAKSFRDNILTRGGTEDPMAMYKRFRGAEPSVEPLLAKRGLK